MPVDPIFLLIGALLLAGGIGLGWFVGSRQSGALAEERGKAAELLRMTLGEVSKERDEAQRELAGLQADARNFDVRIKELAEAKDLLAAQFSEVGSKLLQEAQKNFLERADARFNQAGEKHEEKLKALLQPVETTLKRYEEGLGKVEKDRIDSYAGLREAVEQVRAGQGQVRDETARLVNALRSSPKARGRWGEQSLKNVLEQAGLSPYADFQTEVSVNYR
jgi:DNA recombination protein RmuC